MISCDLRDSQTVLKLLTWLHRGTSDVATRLGADTVDSQGARSPITFTMGCEMATVDGITEWVAQSPLEWTPFQNFKDY